MHINAQYGRGFGLLTGLKVNLKKQRKISSKHIQHQKEILAGEDLLGSLLDN
jgi:hypothetical protein